LISSDDETPILWDYKKHLKKEKVIDIYVDNLRIKKLQKVDVKLLEVAGFRKVLELINKARAVERVVSEWGDHH